MLIDRKRTGFLSNPIKKCDSKNEELHLRVQFPRIILQLARAGLQRVLCAKARIAEGANFYSTTVKGSLCATLEHGTPIVRVPGTVYGTTITERLIPSVPQEGKSQRNLAARA